MSTVRYTALTPNRFKKLLEGLTLRPTSDCRCAGGDSCSLHLSLDDDRKRECKSRALAGPRLHPNLAAMHLDDALRYSEPQAGATFLARDRIVGLLKLLKQLGLIGGGDTGSRIPHRHLK